MATKVTLNIIRPSWSEWMDALDKRVPFGTGGSLRGEPGGAVSTGRMSYAERERMLAHGAPDYVIYSYATPVAWWHDGYGWTVTTDRYSATTARQIGRVRTTLAMLDQA